MSTTGSLFTFYTLTPLHAGSGDSAGAIDLPVQREKHTGFPAVFSSSMKGSLRCFAEGKWFKDKARIEKIFGKEGVADKDSAAGTIVFTDAKILLFPVRASKGVFKWVTCPLVLERLRRDILFLGGASGNDYKIVVPQKGEAIDFSSEKSQQTESIVIEDFALNIVQREYAVLTALKILTGDHFSEDELKKRLLIVSDDVFTSLVRNSTQIIARNVLKDESKTSANLWYEEVVPCNAMFYTIFKPVSNKSDALTDVDTLLAGNILQIGGNETIGYGFVRLSKEVSESFARPEEKKP